MKKQEQTAQTQPATFAQEHICRDIAPLQGNIVEKVLIDKNELLFRLTAARNTALGTQHRNPQEVCEVFDAVIDLVESFDAETEQIKYGAWVRNSESGQAYCSVCRERPLSITATDGDVFTVLPNFCPHCGAKMDGKEG